jgi:hypothetical protein
MLASRGLLCWFVFLYSHCRQQPYACLQLHWIIWDGRNGYTCRGVHRLVSVALSYLGLFAFVGGWCFAVFVPNTWLYLFAAAAQTEQLYFARLPRAGAFCIKDCCCSTCGHVGVPQSAYDKLEFVVALLVCLQVAHWQCCVWWALRHVLR